MTHEAGKPSSAHAGTPREAQKAKVAKIARFARFARFTKTATTDNITKRPGRGRRRAIRFIVLFVVYVLSMLTAYRYAINTEVNMWYLYHVARNTAALLNLTGHHGEVKPPTPPYSVERTRNELKVWRSGDVGPRFTSVNAVDALVNTSRNWKIAATSSDPENRLYIRARFLPDWLMLLDKGDGTATLDAISSPDAQGNHVVELVVIDDEGLSDSQTLTIRVGTRGSPSQGVEDRDDGPVQLSAWERWLHQAYTYLRNGESLQERGPLVHFVARQGLNARIKETHQQVARLSRNDTITPAEKEKRKAKLKARLDTLYAKKASYPKGEKRTAASEDKIQDFILVPDCGAIPSISIFIAAVLAFPAPWRKRLVGIAAGVPILYVVNLFRVSVLAFIGAFDSTPGQQWFRFTHEYVWSGIFIIFVVMVWMGWIEFVVSKRRQWKRRQ